MLAHCDVLWAEHERTCKSNKSHMQIVHYTLSSSTALAFSFSFPSSLSPTYTREGEGVETRHLSSLSDIKNILTQPRDFDKRNKNCSYHAPSSSALKNMVMHLPIQHLILPFREKKKIYFRTTTSLLFSRTQLHYLQQSPVYEAINVGKLWSK